MGEGSEAKGRKQASGFKRSATFPLSFLSKENKKRKERQLMRVLFQFSQKLMKDAYILQVLARSS